MPALALLCVAAAFAALLIRACMVRGVSSLPPGPRSLPLLGNLHQLPSNFLFRKLDEWGQVHGPIFTFRLGPQPVVVLNSAKVAADILDRLSGLTSSRPPFIKSNVFLTHHGNMVLMPHDDVWRASRKGAHESLNVRACKLFHPMQEDEAAILVRGLLHSPTVDLVHHLHRFSSSVIWRALYGAEPIALEGPDPSKRVEELAPYLFEACLPGKSVVDIFPLLRPIIARFKFLRRRADAFYDETTELYTRLFRTACSTQGNMPCISHALNVPEEKSGLSATKAAWLTGTLFFAAQDTTATTLRFLILALLLHPEVARKAQQDLDEIVGDRPPTLDDRARLPYVDAIIKECVRWRPGAPLGIAHVASEDIRYEGYVIPKDTLIMDNLWTMCHDPLLYSDPDAFRPSRFLDAEGRLKPGNPDTHDDYLGFGHGRRVCVGKDFALASLFASTAYLLWAFDFKKPKDKDGNEITPSDTEMVDTFLTVQPAPYAVDFVPRFSDLGERLV